MTLTDGDCGGGGAVDEVQRTAVASGAGLGKKGAGESGLAGRELTGWILGSREEKLNGATVAS
jgi:hypothetical protein